MESEATSSRILRRSLSHTLLTATLLLVAVLAIGCASSRRAAAGDTIRVMSWNIHHAEGMDQKVDVHRLAKLILSEKADIVALQEVDRGVERSKKIDIITTLADLTGMTYAFGKTIDLQRGEYGNAFLTRYPIIEERNFLYRMIRRGEQRGLLQLILEIRGEEVVVANTHLDNSEDDTGRIASVEELRSTLKRYPTRPIVLCGSFNDAPKSRVITEMKEEYADPWDQAGTGDGFTYPSNAPRKRIDYMFVQKNPKPNSAGASVQIRPVSARVLPSVASDHLPLVVDFELKTER